MEQQRYQAVIEEIKTGFYRVELPLPNNPLKSLNSYMLKSPARNLIIDTGLNRPECWEAMRGALEELAIDLSRTDIMLTHYHADHCGLAAKLMTETSTAYCVASEAVVVNQMGHWSKHWQTLGEYARIHGFPQEELDKALENHPGRLFSPRTRIEFHDLQEGDTFQIGDYNLRCIATPGHTHAHICLYDAHHKLLISGDHILGDITPNISQWYDDSDDLNHFFQSLDKVAGLEVELVLPAHRRTFTHFRERIEELRQHHQARLSEILPILERGGRMSAYQIAGRMTWDMRGTWQDFAVQQRWFATGEAIAHVKYLERQGKVRKMLDGDLVYYQL